MLDEKYMGENEIPVQQRNRVIADFDGWERVYPGTASRNNRGLAQFKNKDGRGWHCYIYDGVGEGIYPPFSTEWSFLIPVWKKCIEVLFDLNSIWRYTHEFHKAVDTNDIHAAYRIVHDFIIEYIKQSDA